MSKWVCDDRMSGPKLQEYHDKLRNMSPEEFKIYIQKLKKEESLKNKE